MSNKQEYALRAIDRSWIKSRADASLAISALKNPEQFRKDAMDAIKYARTETHLDVVAKRIFHAGKGHVQQQIYQEVLDFGRAKRTELRGGEF